MKKDKIYDIGVIIGRFQIHELHVAHKKLIEHVIENHQKVILFLGVSPAINTRKNPLDFVSRKAMIEEMYGHRITAILPINDKRSNAQWAKEVDLKIREIFPLGNVVLYGSKDSFIPYYEPYGKFDTCELEPETMISATEVREKVKNEVLRSKEFRAGMIYAANSTFPFNYVTIDVAILNEDNTKVLLGRKPLENEFRFIGGFTDITDECFEHTVRREAQEETGLEIGNIQYVSSHRVQDWRYAKEEDRSIITTFFKANKVFGQEKANDDIAELIWMDLDNIINDKFLTNRMVNEHQELMVKLLKNLGI